MAHNYNMQWFKDDLQDIQRPYNLRGLYNRHKLFVLDKGYDHMLARISELEVVFECCGLELKTLEDLRLDLECDREDLARKREEVRLMEEVGIVVEIEEKNRNEWEYQSGNIVKIAVIQPTKNLLTELEKEAIIFAHGECGTQVATAKMLGISVRTLRNKIDKYFKGSLNENFSQQTM